MTDNQKQRAAYLRSNGWREKDQIFSRNGLNAYPTKEASPVPDAWIVWSLEPGNLTELGFLIWSADDAFWEELS